MSLFRAITTTSSKRQRCTKRRSSLEFDLDGVTQHERGKIADVYTADGAEFVKFVGDAGPIDIRLDHIISISRE